MAFLLILAINIPGSSLIALQQLQSLLTFGLLNRQYLIPSLSGTAIFIGLVFGFMAHATLIYYKILSKLPEVAGY